MLIFATDKLVLVYADLREGEKVYGIILVMKDDTLMSKDYGLV